MFMFIGDETNATQTKQSRFFIYGGLIIDADKCAEANLLVKNIRKKYHFTAQQDLKFDTRSPERTRRLQQLGKRGAR